MRIISSELGLRLVVALAAVDELSLTELARALGVGPSAAQRALEIVLADGLVERTRQAGRAPYRLADTEATQHLVALARAVLSPEEAFSIVAGANPAVEFLSVGPGVVSVVFAGSSTVHEQALAARQVDAIAKRSSLRPDYRDHDDVRRRLLDDPRLRTEMGETTILHGSLDRSFPDRSRHGMGGGHPLGRPNPALRLPSKVALRALLRRHRLHSLKLFGSAVRSDFGPDSDVDALISYEPDVRPTLASLNALERDLERLFRRDVDVIQEASLQPAVRTTVEREAVQLQ